MLGPVCPLRRRHRLERLALVRDGTEPGQLQTREAFNKATKYVVTRSLERLDWENSQHIGGDVVDEVRRLKASDGGLNTGNVSSH